MRDFLIGSLTIATGICLAAAVITGAWVILQPAKAVIVDLGAYSCATDGKMVECQRK